MGEEQLVLRDGRGPPGLVPLGEVAGGVQVRAVPIEGELLVLALPAIVHQVGVFVVVVPRDDLDPLRPVADDALPHAGVAGQALHVADVGAVVVRRDAGHVKLAGKQARPSGVGVGQQDAPRGVVRLEQPLAVVQPGRVFAATKFATSA